MALIKKHNAGGKAGFRDYITKKLYTEGGLDIKAQELINQALPEFDPIVEYEEKSSNNINNINSANSWLKETYKEFEKVPDQVSIKPEEGWGPRKRDIGTLFDYIVESDYGGNHEFAEKSIAKMTDNEKTKKYVVKNMKALVTDYLSQKSTDDPNNEWAKVEEVEKVKEVLNDINEEEGVSDETWEKLTAFSNKLDWQLPNFIKAPKAPEDPEIIAKREANAKIENAQLKFNTDLENLSGTKLDEETKLYLIQNKYGLVNTPEGMAGLEHLETSKKDNNLQIFRKLDNPDDILVFKDGKPATGLNGMTSDNRFNKKYGETWSIGDDAIFKTYSPDKISENTGFVLPEDPYSKNVGINLITDDPKYAGYTIVGDSGEDGDLDSEGNSLFTKDVLNRRDLTKKIAFKSPDGEVTVAVRDDKGIYRHWKTNEVFMDMPEFKGYGKIEAEKKEDLNKFILNKDSVFYGIPGIKRIEEKNINDEYKKFLNEVNAKTASGERISYSGKQLLNLGQSIVYQLLHGPEANKEKYAEMAFKLMELYKTSDSNGDILGNDSGVFSEWNKLTTANKVGKYGPKPEYMQKNKFGGVLFAQKGDKLTLTERLRTEISNNKLAREELEKNSTPESNESDKDTFSGSVDTKGTLKDASAKEIGSLVASGVSFIPGVGVFGGAAATILDALTAQEKAKAEHRNWNRGDYLELAANAGFTVLSLAGLGSLKGLKVAGKAGKYLTKASKLADVTSDSSKAFNKVNKAVKFAGKIGDEGSDIIKSTDKIKGIAKSLGVTEGKGFAKAFDNLHADELIEIANKSDYKLIGKTTEELAESAKKLIQSDLDIIKIAGNAKTGAIAETVQTIGNTAAQIGASTWKPIKTGVKYGLPALSIGSGVVGGVNMAGNISKDGWVEGIKNTQVSDLSSVLFGAASARGTYKMARNARDFAKNTQTVWDIEPKKVVTTTLNGKETQHIVEGKVADPRNMGQWAKGIFREKVEGSGLTKNQFAKFQAELEQSAPKVAAQIAKEVKLGATIKYKDIPGQGQRVFINSGPTDLTPRGIRGYMRTQNMINTGTSNPMSPKFGFTHFKSPKVKPISYASYLKENPVEGAVVAAKEAQKVSLKTSADAFKDISFTVPATAKTAKTSVSKTVRDAQKSRRNLIKSARPLKDGSIPHSTVTSGHKFKSSEDLNMKFPNIKVAHRKVETTPEKVVEKVTEIVKKGRFTPERQAEITAKRLETMKNKKAAKETQGKLFKEGGIIKMYTGGIASLIGGMLPAIKYAETLSKNKNTIKPHAYVNNAALPQNGILGMTNKLNSGAIKRFTDNSIIQDKIRKNKEGNFDSTVDAYVNIPNKAKPYSNIVPALESLRFGIGEWGNSRNIGAQQRASAEIPKLSHMTAPHFRTSTPFSAVAETMAGKTRNIGRRLLNSSSDINGGYGAMFTANKQANDIELQGKYQDMQLNNQIQGQQQQSDSKVNEYNLQVSDKQSAMGSSARANISRLSGMGYAQTAMNWQNYLAAMGKEAQMHPHRKAMWDYTQKLQNPNYQGVFAHLEQLSSDEGRKKNIADFNKWADAEKITYGVRPDYVGSKFETAYNNNINKYTKLLTSMGTELNTSKNVVMGWEQLNPNSRGSDRRRRKSDDDDYYNS